MEHIINIILNKYKNNEYKIEKISEKILPEIIDIKESVEFFLMYKWHQNNPEMLDFYKSQIDYIVYPTNINHDFSNFKSIDDYINITQYIKYNVTNEEIILSENTINKVLEINNEVLEINNEVLEINNEVLDFIDYSKMKKSELKKECKKKNKRRFYKLRKQQLIDLLNEK